MNLYNNGHIVTVGVGDLKIARSPKIIKTSLGSCVGVVFYDSRACANPDKAGLKI